MRVDYGKGSVLTQRGKVGGHPCLMITRHSEQHPIGAILEQYDTETTEDQVDVLLVFENIESARTLQDELSLLIALWSYDIGKAMELP